MKKIGKKLSFLTKVFLVLGLLFSNLSSLSVVFAYEVTDDFTVTVEDNIVKIKYLEELNDTDQIKIIIKENYTYLDGTHETELDDDDTTDGTTIKNTDGTTIKSTYLYTSQMLTNVKFDGLYEISVSLLNVTTSEEKELGVVNSSKNIAHNVGLKYEAFDISNNQISLNTDGFYETNGSYKVVANIQAGLLLPNKNYTISSAQHTGEYTSEELLELSFSKDGNFASNHVYGEHGVDFDLIITDENSNTLDFSTTVPYMYKTYEQNDILLNDIVNLLRLDNIFNFAGKTKDGNLFVSTNEVSSYSIKDIIKILKHSVNGTDIEYSITDGENIYTADSYNNYVASLLPEDTPLTEDEYYDSINLNDGAIISLSDEDLTITYKVVYLGDMNNDGKLTDEDILLLINQVVGADEENLPKTDLNKDEKLNLVDAATLYQVLLNDSWTTDQYTENGTLDAKLEVNDTDIVSGDTFTVDYMVTLTENTINGIEGTIKYDESMLELISIEKSINEMIGNNKDGKFLYMNGDSLELVTDPESVPANEYVPTDYTVLTATFRALKGGTSSISIDDYMFMNNLNTLTLNGENITVDVTVNKSDNNNLSSLTVSGQSIELEENVLDYELTVENNNTSSVVEAIIENIAAEISSIVAPEQLSVGKNEVIITVKAENGDEKIYKVEITRKEAEKPKTTQTSYQTNPSTENNVTTPPVDDDNDDDVTEPVEEESNLSRIIIIILILLVIAGLIYLIFKDEEDEETKIANKEIDKLKRDSKKNEVQNKAKKEPEKKQFVKKTNKK